MIFVSSYLPTGIGYQTALSLAKRNARVILACRNKERAEAAREAMIRVSGNDQIVFRKLDLSSFKSVREFAEEIIREEERVDILVNNAGVIGGLLFKTLCYPFKEGKFNLRATIVPQNAHQKVTLRHA